MHNRICCACGYAQILDPAQKVCILFIDDQHIKEVAVAAGYAHGRHLHTQAAHQFIGRSLDWSSTDDGTDCDHHTTGFVKHIINTRDGGEAPHNEHWVTWGEQKCLALLFNIHNPRPCFVPHSSTKPTL